MGFHRKQSVNYIPQADLPLAIREAERIIELYKTRDPFEIIDCRKIKLRFTDRFFNLLGYFVVKHKQAYIGINAKVDEATQRTVAAHELAHAIMHYLEAAKKNGGFQDTMLFSLATGKMEQNANLFAGELLLPDEYILESCAYHAYQDTIRAINEGVAHYRTAKAKRTFEQEMLNEFYDEHPDIPTYEDLARENGVDVHLVEFKLLALKEKGFDMPNLPDTRNDFLRR